MSADEITVPFHAAMRLALLIAPDVCAESIMWPAIPLDAVVHEQVRSYGVSQCITSEDYEAVERLVWELLNEITEPSK